MKIYTRGGDKGRTGIHGGERVDKDDIRIEANGTLDEVNAEIGIIRALLPAEHEWQSLLGKIQMEMMAVMSHVATPSAIRDKNPNKISDDLVLVCEEQIDALSAKMEDNGYFILPGGSLVSAHLQLARTIVRRAERRLWTLNRKDPVSPGIMQFVNRLSDLFFTMARYEMFRQGNAEERWQSFLYKRKNRIRLEDSIKKEYVIFVRKYENDMFVTFEEVYLRDLYEKGKADNKKPRYQPDVIRRYQKCIDFLLDAKKVEELLLINSLNYEMLKGDKAGISFVRVNNKYRVEFTVRDSIEEPIVTVCNIIELSNHYK